MFLITNSFLYFIFFNYLVQIQSLVDLPAFEDNHIVATETTIRNTLNNIFSTLKFNLKKPKWKQYIKIHDYFFSITLQDHDNLKEVSRLVQVNNIDNSIQIFITQLNEVLNKDNKSDETTDAVYITLVIQTFLEGLDHLKETYGIKSNVSNFDINKTVLKILDSEEQFDNTTSECETNDTDITIGKGHEFWEPSGRRIYRGTRVNSIKQFPFMASIMFFKKFQCAGSIIKSDLIITSASCLQLAWNNRLYRENPAFLSVMVGSKFFEIGSEIIPILEIYFHPNYNPKTLKHNLAIIRLLRHLRLSKHESRVKKIDFDRNAWPMPNNINGITIVGWGARGTSNLLENPWKNRLAFAVLDIYPLRECQEVYSKEYVTDKNFCAGFFSKGGGACNHDAGGPGVVHGTLMGVISFGSPLCGAPDAPTVFTKLGFYTDWIEGIMEQRVKRVAKKTTLKPEKIAKITTPYKATTFKTEPIDEEDSAQPEPEALQEIDQLRVLDQNELFNQFLKTVFENDDFNEENSNEEAQSEESGDIIKTTTKPKPKVKPKTNTRTKNGTKSNAASKLKSSTHATTKMIDVNEKDEPPKYTKIVNTDAPAKPELKGHKRQSKNKGKKGIQSKSVKPAEDKNLKKVIAKLISQIKEDDFKKFTQSKKHKENPSTEYDSESNEQESDSNTKDASHVDDTVRKLLHLFEENNKNEEKDNGSHSDGDIVKDENYERNRNSEEVNINEGVNENEETDNVEEVEINEEAVNNEELEINEFDNNKEVETNVEANNNEETEINEEAENNEENNEMVEENNEEEDNNHNNGQAGESNENFNNGIVDGDENNNNQIDAANNNNHSDNGEEGEYNDEANNDNNQNNVPVEGNDNEYDENDALDGRGQSAEIVINETNEEDDEKGEKNISNESEITKNIEQLFKENPDIEINNSENEEDRDFKDIIPTDKTFKSKDNDTEKLLELLTKSDDVYKLLANVFRDDE